MQVVNNVELSMMYIGKLLEQDRQVLLSDFKAVTSAQVAKIYLI